MTRALDIARFVLDEHRITQKALEPYVEAIRADQVACAEVMDLIFEDACRRLLDRAHADRTRESREAFRGGPTPAQRSADVTAWGGAVANALLDGFEIRPGLKLGDATRKDISEAAEAWATKAVDAGVKHRWLRLVAQGLPDGVKTREHYTEQRLAELKGEAAKLEAA